MNKPIKKVYLLEPIKPQDNLSTYLIYVENEQSAREKTNENYYSLIAGERKNNIPPVDISNYPPSTYTDPNKVKCKELRQGDFIEVDRDDDSIQILLKDDPCTTYTLDDNEPTEVKKKLM